MEAIIWDWNTQKTNKQRNSEKIESAKHEQIRSLVWKINRNLKFQNSNKSATNSNEIWNLKLKKKIKAGLVKIEL